MKWYYWLIIAASIILLYMERSVFNDLFKKLVLIKLEGFSSKPYWDFMQWTWGYGTKVPGSSTDPNKRPLKTITREQAAIEALSYSEKDKVYLSKYLKRKLTDNEMIALLSFSYNLGSPTALKLIAEINNKSASLENHWKQYIYAGGKKNDVLIARRKYEWNLYKS